MSIFRDEARIDESKLETIKGACPVCKSDVIGDDVYMFYCKKCNLLFKREELLYDSPEQISAVLKEKIAQKYEKDRELLQMPEMTPIKEKKLDDKKIKILIEHREQKAKKIYYYASKNSDIVHASNCPYGKNIKKENRIVFSSLAQAKRYKKCRCIVE